MRYRFPMLDPFDTRRPDGSPRLPDPAAGTGGAIGDGAPSFASQIDASIALHDRLNRDVVRHALNHRTPSGGGYLIVSATAAVRRDALYASRRAAA